MEGMEKMTGFMDDLSSRGKDRGRGWLAGTFLQMSQSTSFHKKSFEQKEWKVAHISNTNDQQSEDDLVFLRGQFVQQDPGVDCLVWHSLAKAGVIQARDMNGDLYDRWWSFHCSSTDALLFNTGYNEEHISNQWVGVSRNRGIIFLPKQFEKARSGRRRPLLSVTQAGSRAIWDCGTWSATLRHVTLMRHDHSLSSSYHTKQVLILNLRKRLVLIQSQCTFVIDVFYTMHRVAEVGKNQISKILICRIDMYMSVSLGKYPCTQIGLMGSRL